MIVEMRKGASKRDIQSVVARAEELGLEVQLNSGTEKTVVAILGSNTGEVDVQAFEVLPGVEKVARIMKQYKLASRDFKREDTIVKIGDVEIGGKDIVIMAGPCAVENEEQLLTCARLVKEVGGKVLRGGAFKPRTSPFKFRGLGEEGMPLLEKVKRETGLLIVSEVTTAEHISSMKGCVDILQVGSRNMQNFDLLEKVAESGLPVLLKRGFAATIEEMLMAADYVLKRDGCQVILCERGIRTFDNSTRFTLDVGAVPVVKRFSHLPIIIDPSHSGGYFEYVPALARAGIAAGADGVLIEIHPNPKKALVDGAQSLTFSDFRRLTKQLEKVAEAVGRRI